MFSVPPALALCYSCAEFCALVCMHASHFLLHSIYTNRFLGYSEQHRATCHPSGKDGITLHQRAAAADHLLHAKLVIGARIQRKFKPQILGHTPTRACACYRRQLQGRRRMLVTLNTEDPRTVDHCGLIAELKIHPPGCYLSRGELDWRPWQSEIKDSQRERPALPSANVAVPATPIQTDVRSSCMLITERSSTRKCRLPVRSNAWNRRTLIRVRFTRSLDKTSNGWNYWLCCAAE